MPGVTMGFFTFLKTIFVPAFISLTLYIILTYAFLPFYRRHRQRYAQYLPLDTFSTQAQTLKERMWDAFMNILLPSTWTNRMRPSQHRYAADDGGSLFDEEEGEGMVGVGMDAHGRTRPQPSAGADESGRRLSRELEEGFRDDSDEEGRDPNRGTR